jgi:hypothetical protein
MATAVSPGVAKVTKKRSWRGATIAALLLSAGLLGLAVISQDDGKIHLERKAMPEQIQRCTADADCTLVDKISCCDCQSGGAQGAINSTQQDAFRRFLKVACRHHAVCVRVDTCQRDLVPACSAGRCVASVSDG